MEKVKEIIGSKEGKPLKIAFIHPDLGIGGAERLVVDAAMGLKEAGHEVHAYANHCDKSHCFEEIKDGSFKVTVYGDAIPSGILGKFYIIFANIKQFYLIYKMIQTGEIKKYDLFFVDQLSTCVPFFHYFSDAKILFYCHFPDQLMTSRTNIIKKIYRLPFDLLEQMTISASDCIAVNSKFTRSMYKKTFNFLKNEPEVVYPCVELGEEPVDETDKVLLKHLIGPKDRFYLSINRFQKKKDIDLALKAFALSSESKDVNVKLLVCGGYDKRVIENVFYHNMLERLADSLRLKHTTIFYPEYRTQKDLKNFDVSNAQVIFLTSISSSLKTLLLQDCDMLLYTPTNEHFGIVPLEAMKYGKPVLAANSGGPLETVTSYVKGKNESIATGWQRDPSPKLWAEALEECRHVLDKKLVNFKHNGPKRVKEEFSRSAMTQTFENCLKKFMNKKKVVYGWEKFMPLIIASPIFFGLLLLILIFKFVF